MNPIRFQGHGVMGESSLTRYGLECSMTAYPAIISFMCGANPHPHNRRSFSFYCFILSPHSGMLLRAVKGSWGLVKEKT